MKVSIKSQIHLMLKLKQRWAKCMAIDPKQRWRKLFQVVGAGQNFFHLHSQSGLLIGLVSKSLSESGSVLDSSHSRRVLLEK